MDSIEPGAEGAPGSYLVISFDLPGSLVADDTAPCQEASDLPTSICRAVWSLRDVGRRTALGSEQHTRSLDQRLSTLR